MVLGSASSGRRRAPPQSPIPTVLVGPRACCLDWTAARERTRAAASADTPTSPGSPCAVVSARWAVGGAKATKHADGSYLMDGSVPFTDVMMPFVEARSPRRPCRTGGSRGSAKSFQGLATTYLGRMALRGGRHRRRADRHGPSATMPWGLDALGPSSRRLCCTAD